MAPPLTVWFSAGACGPWKIERIDAVVGEPMPPATRLTVAEGIGSPAEPAAWVLRGTTSNERYVERDERSALVEVQQPLGRPEASCAALIPIRKREAWWELTQDERRAILEDRSKHIETGLGYLPAISRRLHHCRDLGEPFDFLTWFDFAPAAAGRFEELVGRLRSTEEWTFVDREVDIRLVQDRP